MEPASPPPSAYVLAQTGPGSAFSAGSPTDTPLREKTEGKQPGDHKKTPPAPPTPPAPSTPPAEHEDEPPPARRPAAGAPTVQISPQLNNPGYAATDYRPRGVVEKDLCARASSPDYVYILGTAALTAGAVMFDTKIGKHSEKPFWRIASTGLIGVTMGSFIGGGYLSLPKCSPDFVPPVQPEGDTASRWPLAIALSVAAGVVSPFLVWVETGFVPEEWSMSERGARIYVPALAGVAGALLPWIPAIAPKTYRNMLKLERLRLQGAPVPPGANTAATGAMLGYSFQF